MTAHKDLRPLSPHLQIYRPQITSVLSILHRITGFALSVGTLFLVFWLYAAAYAAELFTTLETFALSIPGELMLAGWTFALFFHLCNGIRHLFWDIGRGFELQNATRSGWAVVVVSIFMTICTWITVCDQL